MAKSRKRSISLLLALLLCLSMGPWQSFALESGDGEAPAAPTETVFARLTMGPDALWYDAEQKLPVARCVRDDVPEGTTLDDCRVDEEGRLMTEQEGELRQLGTVLTQSELEQAQAALDAWLAAREAPSALSVQPQEPQEPQESQEPQEPQEPQETQETQENNEEQEQQQEEKPELPAFSASETVEGVTVTVSAAEGVFPADAQLHVTAVPQEAQTAVDAAVDAERPEGKNVALKYTFDIKIFDAQWNELQPAEGQEVKVSFAMAAVVNTNVETGVYHVTEDAAGALTATALEVETNEAEETATVTTEGFSYYTVEFTYGEKQYVLQGGWYVRLSEILESVGLSGEASSWEISDDSLFNIYMGDEYGIACDVYFDDLIEIDVPIDMEGGTVPYMVSLQPFDTEERLDVVIDDIPYSIVVTDAIIQTSSGSYDVDGVRQGENGDDVTYMKLAPLVDITLLNDKLTETNATISIGAQAAANGFSVNGSTLVFAAYDEANSQSRLSTTDQYNVFSYGNEPLATYTFKDAAKLEDDGTADVVVYYNALYLIPTLGNNVDYYGNVSLGNGITMSNRLEASSKTPSNGSIHRLGVEVDLSIRVERNGQPVQGSFYFPMKGLTNKRTATPSWVTDLGGFNDPRFGDVHTFNEGFIVHSGYTDLGDGTKFFIPGNTSIEYKCSIDKQGDRYYFYCDPDGGNTANLDNSTHAGFETVVNGGISATYIAGVGVQKSRSGVESNYVVNNNLLSGTEAHSIQSSSGTGGTIKTTTGSLLAASNPNGDLNDGTPVLDSGTYTVPDGKSVTYTITPRSSDYRLKSVTVDGTTITTLPGSTGGTQTVTLAGGRTGTLTNMGNGVYSFTFPQNNYDHKIHVDWEADHWFEKTWMNEQEEKSSLTFELKAYLFNGTAFTYEAGTTKTITVDKPTSSTGDGNIRTVNADGTVTWRIKRTDLAIEKVVTNNHDGDHHAPLYWFARETVPTGYRAIYDNSGASAPVYYELGEYVLDDPSVQVKSENVATITGTRNSLIQSASGQAYLSTHNDDYGVVTNLLERKLTIEKKVDGNQASRDKFFKFTVELSGLIENDVLRLDKSKLVPAPQGNAATIYPGGTGNGAMGAGDANGRDDKAPEDVYEADGVTLIERRYTGQDLQVGDDGTASLVFYLQHGNTLTIEGLPTGCSYTVTEIQEDYRPHLKLEGSDQVSGDGSANQSNIEQGNGVASAVDSSMRDDTKMSFTNTRAGIVPTGVALDSRGMVLAMLGAADVLCLLFYLGKRRRYGEG